MTPLDLLSWQHEGVTTAADIRAGARARVRDVMLDAAHGLAVTGGWGAVRMGAVAAQVGVSRQTLHTEFGTKESLGQALVLRVTDRFLAGVAEALDEHPGRLREGLQAAVQFTLEQAERDPLLQTVLAGTRAVGDETLLPLLTSRGQPLLARATHALSVWVAAHHPDLAGGQVAEVLDSVVRLVVSHVVLLVDPPQTVAARVARLAERGLGGSSS